MKSTNGTSGVLEKTSVNFVPLTPLSFLLRTAEVYPDRTAIIYGERRVSWKTLLDRSRRIASALAAAGVGVGDTVAVVAANTPEMLELHFGVPMCGAVLNTLNVRLDPATLSFMLQHGEAKVLITDTEYADVVGSALDLLKEKPIVIDIVDPSFVGGHRLGRSDFEQFLAGGDPTWQGYKIEDEWQSIALNYTSGTTGNPKGVVYHHRGAYLVSLSNMIDWGMPRHAVFLWTLPLFHCNGWGFAWTLAANAGTSVCMRKVEVSTILSAIREHQVTHYCGAPIVHAMLAFASDEEKRGIRHAVCGLIGGAPAPAPVIEALQKMGIEITQIYGLTEVFGPSAVCAEQDEWKSLGLHDLVKRKSRQGVRYTVQEGMAVLDPMTMLPVPMDGETVGEIMFRGNMTMKGYLKNPEATQEAFEGGWFHSGDLAVLCPDGYVQIRDRSKDVIISGGENINSLELEEALYTHPSVRLAAVVAQPDPRWGESPCAFVELVDGVSTSETELIEHCRTKLARFKVPKKVVIGPLPKTSTGKIQKFQLRQQLMSSIFSD
ncbi:acyl-CoA synthetase [Hydrogenophaga taeniospiralis]|uniref:acyl-CoA synthetase n=1 Tax=Hydrogenophaga taeniospiralis TaxID=65656 RepID=UPI001CFAD994|nr:acyl-CoA synthetase [Hydrogenophaga taeniospiralis]UCU94950.1 acyl-CoA synthetase [Hydrogenophaga taeniospiralis]